MPEISFKDTFISPWNSDATYGVLSHSCLGMENPQIDETFKLLGRLKVKSVMHRDLNPNASISNGIWNVIDLEIQLSQRPDESCSVQVSGKISSEYDTWICDKASVMDEVMKLFLNKVASILNGDQDLQQEKDDLNPDDPF